ncbi:hypothetical protein D9615_009748 [Tricholomella constricta]|uniref:PARP catalytic domain-containing protein n=1 Tax=Tricholomella constricta TaxID=117010 RepID=A0A8H5LUX8_9AGAR|nr:hypothetical protein D9615_009748 [Tricholomella constricta]
MMKRLLQPSTALCQHCHQRPVYSDGVKTHSYCGKTCANKAEFSQNGSTAQLSSSNMCEVCQVRPKYQEPGKTHPYCSKTCARSRAGNISTNPKAVGPPPSRTLGMCHVAGCPKQAFRDRDGSFADFCSKTHRKLGETICLMCRAAPKLGETNFCGKTCMDNAYAKGPMLLEVLKGHVAFKSVADQFKVSWRHQDKRCPPVRHVYKVIMSQVSMEAYEAYRAEVEARGKFTAQNLTEGNEKRRWHGTKRNCTIGDNGRTTLCNARPKDCPMCSIIRTSFTLDAFGRGIYASSTSSKSDDYTTTLCSSKLTAIFLSKVVVGRGRKMSRDAPKLTDAPPNYDSVLAETGGSLNHDELIVYTNDAIRPSFLVIFEHSGQNLYDRARLVVLHDHDPYYRLVKENFECTWQHANKPKPPVYAVLKILTPESSLAAYSAYRSFYSELCYEDLHLLTAELFAEQGWQKTSTTLIPQIKETRSSSSTARIDFVGLGKVPPTFVFAIFPSVDCAPLFATPLISRPLARNIPSAGLEREYTPRRVRQVMLIGPAIVINGQAAMRNGSTPMASNMCDFCKIKPKWRDSSGKLHPFCSKTCAHKGPGSTPTAQGAVVSPPQTAFGMCHVAGCPKQAFKKSNGSSANYCGQTHRKLGETICLFCRARPRFGVDSNFCGKTCMNNAYAGGPMLLEVLKGDDIYESVADQFRTSWRHSNKQCPPVRHVYKIIMSNSSMASYKAYRAQVDARGRFPTKGNENRRWHGTRRKCNLGDNGLTTLCTLPDCPMCCIIKTSFSLAKFASNTSWGRFGRGIYASATSSKSDDYSKSASHSRLTGMFLSKVVVGRGFKTLVDLPLLTAPPPTFDSVLAETGISLNHDEVVVYREDAIRPSFLVIYER